MSFNLPIFLPNFLNYKSSNDSVQLWYKVKEIIPDLFIKIHDISYEKIIKSKIDKREQRIIYFGNSKNLSLIKPDKTEEFFLDITFQIIPKQYRPYKLLVLAGLPKKETKPILITFVLLKYLDEETYNQIFLYLKENFGFNPKIIHSDFEKAIASAIKKNI